MVDRDVRDKLGHEFGLRLAAARKAKNLTREDLADIADVNRTFVGHLEQGKRVPTLTTVVRLAEGLGVDPGELTTGLRSGKPLGRARRRRGDR